MGVYWSVYLLCQGEVSRCCAVPARCNLYGLCSTRWWHWCRRGGGAGGCDVEQVMHWIMQAGHVTKYMYAIWPYSSYGERDYLMRVIWSGLCVAVGKVLHRKQSSHSGRFYLWCRSLYQDMFSGSCDADHVFHVIWSRSDHAMQIMWLKPCDAGHVVQVKICKSCNAGLATQVMRCRACEAGHEMQILWRKSCDSGH